MVEKTYQLSQIMHPMYYSPFIGAKIFAGAILIWIILVFILSALLMWLWNITITSIFGIRKITFWEAFRLIIISTILFGGASGFNLSF